MDVCVRTFSDEMGASLARMQLEHAGIRSWVVEQVGGVDPAMNFALGVRLMVAEADAERAAEILSARAEEAEADEEEEADEPAGAGTVLCPLCEGEYCYRGKPKLTGVSAGAAGGLLAVLAAVGGLLFGRVRWRCERCGHVWDDAGAGPGKRTRLPPGTPRPTFRMVRARGGTGFLLGGLVGFLGGALFGGQVAGVLGLVGMVVGTFVGRAFKHGVCSTPDCREPLPPGADACRKCRGVVSGTVRSTEEHYIETARVRRELAAALASEAASESAPRKRKRKRKPAKASGDAV